MTRRDCHGLAATFAARVLRTGKKPEALNLARSYLEVRKLAAALRKKTELNSRQKRELAALRAERQRHRRQLQLMLARVEFALGETSLDAKEVAHG